MVWFGVFWCALVCGVVWCDIVLCMYGVRCGGGVVLCLCGVCVARCGVLCGVVWCDVMCCVV